MRSRKYLKSIPAPTVPAMSGTTHPVDAFLIAKIDAAKAAAAKTPVASSEHFHKTVLPILRDACFRCHGEKDNGGLRLNSREAALKGGDSEAPAVVPGDTNAGELLRRVKSKDESERMPPTGEGLNAKQIAVLETWIKGGASWPAPIPAPESVALPAVVPDAAFFRAARIWTRSACRRRRKKRRRSSPIRRPRNVRY
ncbi:MAG: hypothetical protein QM811_31550 [Pirellulales bacterium]